ncbi:Transposon Ty3-G Gag-Pol polyprotein isoform B [Glycine soja]|uniref:Transposon Ty3-G Gag-Pol polyprotein isoform B n=1 Tax=Glycine soja TaxID=3848 RepID=A0A445JHY5_GLYSO|nr:Transposon Ty3-G Gag-Pol polyprotein isoform B [Glycine soja]
MGLLQPLPIPNAVWEEISMDFIVGLPKSKGYDALLVVIDRLSKYGHFILIKHPYSARSIAEVFTKEVVRLHGIPISIVSDRDPTFLSNFWQELFKLQGTKLKMSTVYHPETDGQTEVLNRTVETYLRCFSSEQPKTWVDFIPWAEYWYNTSFHTAAQSTPFEIVYGRPPPTITRFIPGETLVEAVAQDLMDRDEALKQLKHHLERAQSLMVKHANNHRRPHDINVGDWVYLKIRPHRQGSMPPRLHPKLTARFYGPYLVMRQVGAVAFQLQLPSEARIHPVFHVSQLKRALGNHQAQEELPPDLEHQAELYFPVQILKIREVQKQHEVERQVLIRWHGKSEEEATWENVDVIQTLFPEFNLEDKVHSLEGSIVRSQDRPVSGGYVLKNEKADVYRLPYLASSGPGFALLEAARKANFKGTFSEIAAGFATDRWDKPILLAWGLSDKYLPQSVAEQFQKGNPAQIQLKLIEGAGHMPQEDWPEKVVDTFRVFFF